jgi:hypothetical protein
MIKIIPNFLDKNEINQFMSLWDIGKAYHNQSEIYSCYRVGILDKFNKTGTKFDKCQFQMFRIQMVNNDIDQSQHFHIHLNNPYSFIIFLNDNFTGGEVEFENNQKIIPSEGTMIYFTSDEPHRVLNCGSDRYTLIGFLKNDMFYDDKIKKLI